MVMGRFVTSESDRGNWLDRTEEDLLVQRLAAREGEALGELYDRFGKVTFAIACRITGDEGVAEDLVQEVFLRIWSNPGLFQAQRGSLFSWITAVARNRAIDYLRSTEGRISQGRMVFGGAQVPAASLTFDSHGFPFRLSLAKAVESLPPNQREVIRLAYYEGMSQTEMAVEMKQPLGTVKSWARTALVALRQEVVAS
jgi:RNA polymerase sigma-70 factor (ECF subfamily)